MWLPTTPYTQTLNYNQRVLINDTGRSIPLAWEVSKVLDTIPVGLTRLTFKQVQADLHVDCAKYGIANLCPYQGECKLCELQEPKYIDAGLEMPFQEIPRGKITYNGKDAKLRVGGSAKTFTAMFWDESQEKYVERESSWKISYMNDNTLICSIVLSYRDGLNVRLSSDCPSGIILKDIKQDRLGSVITCASDKEDIFSVRISSIDNAIKLNCQQLYNMVGKTIVVFAQDIFGQSTAGVEMEVVS